MKTIKATFARAASRNSDFTFWLLVFAIAITDDAKRREKDRCKKRDRQPRRPAGLRPF